MTALSDGSAEAAPPPMPAGVLSKSGIRTALLRVSGLTGLIYILSVVRDVLLANYYGGSAALDILFLATAPSQFLGLEIATLIYLAFLPEFVGAIHQGVGLEALLRRRVGLAAGVGAAVAVLLATIGVFFTRLVAPGFARHEGLDVVRWSLAACSLLVPLFATAGALRAALEAEGRFSAWAIYPGLRSAALVACALLGASSLSIGWLVAGTLLGTLAGPICFAVLAGLHRSNRAATSGVGETIAGALPAAIRPLAGSLALGAVTVSVDNAFASRTGIGGVQALTLATNLLVVPQALIGGAVATVFFPVYASLCAQENYGEAVRVLRRSVRLVAIGLLPFVLLLCSPVGTMVTRIVYRHGRFDESLAVLVSQTAAALALGQIAYATFVLLKQFMLVARAPGALLEGSALYLVAKWIGNRLLVDRLGLPGIGLASSLAAVVTCAYLIIRLLRLRASWRTASA